MSENGVILIDIEIEELEQKIAPSGSLAIEDD